MFLFIFVFANCTKNNAKGFLTPTVYAITLSAASGKPLTSWNIDDLQQVYLTTRNLELTGSCPRDTEVSVSVSGVVEPKNLKCDSFGKFTWAKTFETDGPVELKLVSLKDPKLQSSRKFVIDSIPPLMPEVTTNGGLNFASSTAAFELTGVIAEDAVLVEADAAGTMNLSLPSFTFATQLGWGQSRIYSFVAKDFAGNRSAPVSITVQYQMPTEIAQSGMTSFGLASDIVGTAGGYFASTAGESFETSSGPILSSGGTIQLTLGLVNIGFLP